MLTLTPSSHKKHLRLFTALTVLLTLIGLGFWTAVPIVNAFTPNYNWSNLIDNPTFINTSSMDAGAIQGFLNSLGSGIANLHDTEACDSTIAPYYTHCGQTISAAQIIYDTS